MSQKVPSGYAALNEHSVLDFVDRIPAVRELLGSDRVDWQANEVGDGNLNQVFIVRGPAAAVVVKQALPYLKIVGDAWLLPLRRSFFEYQALCEEARHVPYLVPRAHHFDEPAAAMVMEYLTPHIILRKGLIRGTVYPKLASHIAEFMAQTLFKTSDLFLDAATKKKWVALFCENIELCKITEDLVFTDPYRIAKLNRWTSPQLDGIAATFRQDHELKVAAQRLKLKFLSSAEALIHGDLHSGSIMATPEETKIIDAEFAFFGPMGFDIGAVIGNLLLAFFSQDGHESAPGEREDYRAWLLRTVQDVWREFADRFLALWRVQQTGDAYHISLFGDEPSQAALETERQRYVRQLFCDTVGFAGVKMIRRILGLAHVEDLESIKDPETRSRCEHNALRLGRELVVNAGQFGNPQQICELAACIRHNSQRQRDAGSLHRSQILRDL
jgi:5-methylthioribose kinase